jgi:hypothetical protein
VRILRLAGGPSRAGQTRGGDDRLPDRQALRA